MKKVYQHKFGDGRTITVSIDLSQDIPIIKSKGNVEGFSKEQLNEYLLWRNTVILPDIFNYLTPIQISNLSKI